MKFVLSANRHMYKLSCNGRHFGRVKIFYEHLDEAADQRADALTL